MSFIIAEVKGIEMLLETLRNNFLVMVYLVKIMIINESILFFCDVCPVRFL